MSNPQIQLIETDVLDRFLRYVKIFTTSSHSSTTKPSTPRQWDLLNLLAQEAKDLGWPDIYQDPKGYVIIRIPTNLPEVQPTVAFFAHVDTAEDAPGEHVNPIVHEYQGGILEISPEFRLTPDNAPELVAYQGRRVITSDGSTLLGADDKAGVAEIMAAARFFKENPQWPRANLELIFTSDEEVGRGVEDFPWDQVKARQAYTLDGGDKGSVELECYHAVMMKVKITGVSWHPGYARGQMVNAISMASALINMIPRSESPEATDGRYGCLWVNDFKGAVETATLDIRIRDFEEKECDRRVEMVKTIAKAVEAAFPGGKIEWEEILQYKNMKAGLDARPEVTAKLDEAIRVLGIEPVHTAIRGGTDGARLTEQGLPTPNIFAGGLNFHSRTEWVAVDSLKAATQVIAELAQIWTKK